MEIPDDSITENIIGTITDNNEISVWKKEDKSFRIAFGLRRYKLESVYNCNIRRTEKTAMKNFEYTVSSRPSPAIQTARPKVLYSGVSGDEL